MYLFKGICMPSSVSCAYFFKDPPLVSTPPRYGFLRPLGSGVGGEVFLAKKDDGVMVAVKRMFPGGTHSAEAALRKSQLINHPNVVHAIETYKAFDSEGRLRDHLVLEFVEGDVVARLPKWYLPKQQVLRYARDFLDAITTGYQRGLAYVDLTTFNIMVNSEKVVIIDLRGFEYVNDGMMCQRETSDDWLNSVLEASSEILKMGKWDHDELIGVLQSLADVVRSSPKEPWRQQPISAAPSEKMVACLNAMDQKLKEWS